MYTGIGTPIADTLIPALANETIAPPPTTWTGARSVYWTDNQNWSTGLCPTSTTDVVIDSAAVTVNSSNAKANSLELSNTTLDIPSGDTLTVSGSITLDGSSTIEVDSGGTLVCNNVFTAAGAGGSLTIDGGTVRADATATVAATILIGPNQATLNTAGYSMALDGQIEDTAEAVNPDTYGDLLKTGAGTLTLNGGNTTTGNTYSGGTTVQGGTVLMRHTHCRVEHRNRHRQRRHKVVLGSSTGDGGGQTDNSTVSRNGNLSIVHSTTSTTDNGGGDTTAADVVEFYLQPISHGTTNYTTDFEMDCNDNITANNVTTSDGSGTIYFAVYAGLNQTNDTHADDGIQWAELNFTSTGSIGSEPSSLGLALQNGFGDFIAASTGASTDLNGDGNLDLGSTNNLSPAGWAIFCQNTFVYATGSGAAAGSGDRTNILLGVLAYNYTSASLTDTQTAQVTLDSRAAARLRRSAMSWTAS